MCMHSQPCLDQSPMAMVGSYRCKLGDKEDGKRKAERGPKNVGWIER